MKPKKTDDDDMALPKGMTCGKCKHARRCRELFGGNDENTDCQFSPSRFVSTDSPPPPPK